MGVMKWKSLALFRNKEFVCTPHCKVSHSGCACSLVLFIDVSPPRFVTQNLAQLALRTSPGSALFSEKVSNITWHWLDHLAQQLGAEMFHLLLKKSFHTLLAHLKIPVRSSLTSSDDARPALSSSPFLSNWARRPSSQDDSHTLFPKSRESWCNTLPCKLGLLIHVPRKSISSCGTASFFAPC